MAIRRRCRREGAAKSEKTLIHICRQRFRPHARLCARGGTLAGRAPAQASANAKPRPCLRPGSGSTMGSTARSACRRTDASPVPGPGDAQDGREVKVVSAENPTRAKSGLSLGQARVKLQARCGSTSRSAGAMAREKARGETGSRPGRRSGRHPTRGTLGPAAGLTPVAH